MNPGIYRITDEEYFALPAFSNSLGKLLAQSPAHAQAPPPPETAACKIGTAFHLSVLDPVAFVTTYGQLAPGDGKTKPVKDAREAQRQANPKVKHWLTPAEWEQVAGARAAVVSHPIMAKMLEHSIDRELVIVWTCRTTGVLCKAKIDLVTTYNGRRYILDLKSCLNASPEAFAITAWNRGYITQAAHYTEGWNNQPDSIHCSDFLFCAVEKKAPFGIGLYRVNLLDMGRAQAILLDLRSTYALCQATGDWPGYPQSIQTLTLPHWAISQLERLEESPCL